jgi:putative restriction endonuclease
MARPNSDWTRDEHILAFNLYCKIPFGTIHVNNPRIIQLAKLLGRSVGAVSYKLANFSRLDPTQRARGIRGMPHGAKGEEEVWNEFNSNPESLAFESQRLFAKLSGRRLEDVAEIDENELPKEGLERERLVRLRVNQHFFRAVVLASYGFRCCVTGIDAPQLLVAGHIIPWATDATQRMNPRNGLCLNALHDKAFDRGIMVIADDFTVHFADSLRSTSTGYAENLNWLLKYEGQKITLPKKFAPNLELLAKHRRLCQQKEAFSG